MDEFFKARTRRFYHRQATSIMRPAALAGRRIFQITVAVLLSSGENRPESKHIFSQPPLGIPLSPRAVASACVTSGERERSRGAHNHRWKKKKKTKKKKNEKRKKDRKKKTKKREREKNGNKRTSRAVGVFYHVRLAACHDHAWPHIVVFVSFRLVRRKIYFFTSVLWKRELHRRASERSRIRHLFPRPLSRAQQMQREFRGWSGFSFSSLFFSRFDQGPRAIWILIEKPGFMPWYDDRDCSRANSIICLRDNERVIALARYIQAWWSEKSIVIRIAQSLRS